MTKKYELVCIFDPQLGDAAFEPLVEKYEAQLKAVGAEIVNIDRWGLRKMAYTSADLKQRQQGFYVLYQFTAESDSMGDGLLHELKMDEGVLRHLLVTVTGEFLRVPQLAPENVSSYRPERAFRRRVRRRRMPPPKAPWTRQSKQRPRVPLTPSPRSRPSPGARRGAPPGRTGADRHWRGAFALDRCCC